MARRNHKANHKRRISRALGREPSRSHARRGTPAPGQRPRKLIKRPRKARQQPRTVRKRRRKSRVREADPRLEAAVLEMNRGRSLTATARSLGLSPRTLQNSLRQQRLAHRKGRRWVTKDNRSRRVPVMTGGRFRVLIVRGYDPARLVGEHHHAAGEFVRTNDINLIKPFRGQTVEAVNGRRYVLETNPNALHRIAAMDSPPFHEIYHIVSTT